MDGGWGDWSNWGDCSSDCNDGGTQDRTRNCDSPVKEGTGADCVGDGSESQPCNEDVVCPGKTTLTMSPLSVAIL